MVKESQKARLARLREEEKSRLLETYQEGVSNINWGKVDLSDLQHTLELMQAGKLPRKSRRQWLNESLQEWDNQQIIIPTQKVQDPIAQLIKCQQKFVEL